MDGNVLSTEKVIAGRERLGDGDSESITVLGWEADLAVAEGRAEFGHLEPGRAAVCGAGGGDFGHVKSLSDVSQESHLRGTINRTYLSHSDGKQPGQDQVRWSSQRRR